MTLNSLAKFSLLAGFGLLSAQSTAGPTYSDWSDAINLGPVVNSPYDDFASHVSKSGLSLYFASNRPDGLGGEDLWVSSRASRDDAWTPPVNLGSIINTDANERSPALSRDGHLLFFASSRADGLGGFDIWVAWRAHTHDDFGWQPPVNLGSPVNTASNDIGPSYFENDDLGIPVLYFVSNRPGGLGGIDIYSSELMANGAFGPAVLVSELSGPAGDITPHVRHDELEVFIASNRPGTLGINDLWASTRETVSDPWSEPFSLGPAVNGGFNDTFPSVSSDGQTLFFSSNRPDGFGLGDIYVSTRSKQSGAR
jgi:Tol biopolymer transport system component